MKASDAFLARVVLYVERTDTMSEKGAYRLALLISSTAMGSITTVRIEGRLEATGVPALRESCPAAGRPLRLDLSGLASADAAGVEALRSLIADGAEAHGASLYLRDLLAEDRS